MIERLRVSERTLRVFFARCRGAITPLLSSVVEKSLAAFPEVDQGASDRTGKLLREVEKPTVATLGDGAVGILNDVTMPPFALCIGAKAVLVEILVAVPTKAAMARHCDEKLFIAIVRFTPQYEAHSSISQQ
jgi:hypothetical protein